jgi:dephospho-CoA kinase
MARVIDRWGDRVRKPDGSLDRRAIGRIVFENSRERIALEELVFPYIGKRCRDEVAVGLADPKTRFVVLDAAVMLEAGWNNETDWIVYVDAPRPVRQARLAHRSGWTDSDLAARESAQWPEDVKKSRADEVIVNNSDQESLQKEVDRLLKQWELLPRQSASERRS